MAKSPVERSPLLTGIFHPSTLDGSRHLAPARKHEECEVDLGEGIPREPLTEWGEAV